MTREEALAIAEEITKKAIRELKNNRKMLGI